MSNATTDSNSNIMGIPASTNTTVSSVNLNIPGTSPHKVLLIGEFAAFCRTCKNASVVGDIQVDGNTFYATEVNNLNGPASTLIVVSGIANVAPGTHKFDLRAFTNATDLSAKHRALSVIDLD